jgi:hypothetical protein
MDIMEFFFIMVFSYRKDLLVFTRYCKSIR